MGAEQAIQICLFFGIHGGAQNDLGRHNLTRDATHAHTMTPYEELIQAVSDSSTPTNEAIDFLVNAGLSKRDVMMIAAAQGHVDLLQVVYQRGWHIVDGFDRCRLLVSATGSGSTATSALKVMRWVLDDDDGNFSKDEKHHLNGDEEDHFGIAFSNTLQNEYIDAAAFLLDNHTAFGLPDWSPDKEKEIEYAANEGATKSLDFLCQRWGEEFVTSAVRQALRVDFEPYYEGDIKKWLYKRTRSHVKMHLERAMSLIDGVKQSLPEGEYIKIANEMTKAYRKARN